MSHLKHRSEEENMKDMAHYQERLRSDDPVVRGKAREELSALAAQYRERLKSSDPAVREVIFDELRALAAQMPQEEEPPAGSLTRAGSSLVLRGAVRKSPVKRTGSYIIAPTMHPWCLDHHANSIVRRSAAQAEKLKDLQLDDEVNGDSFCTPFFPETEQVRPTWCPSSTQEVGEMLGKERP